MSRLAIDFAIIGLAFACSAILTRIAMRIAIPDMPNERSAHDTPVPRTGGIAMAGAFFGFLLPLYVFTDLTGPGLFGFAVFAGIAALLWTVALYDDRYVLAALPRLFAQFLAGLIFALLVGRIARIDLSPFAAIDLHWIIAIPLTVLWLVFFINAYNFMDGINGLAAGVGLLVAVFTAIATGPGFAHLVAILLIGVLGGFLLFNFPGGRIFMGDTGSQVLGFVFAALAVLAPLEAGATLPFEFIPFLFLPFIFDVLLTLIVRWRRGEQLMTGHRDHLYQLLIRAGFGHAAVSAIHWLAVAVFGILALLNLNTGWTHWLWLLAAALAVQSIYAVWVYRLARTRGVFAT